jgi:hypothetical protein
MNGDEMNLDNIKESDLLKRLEQWMSRQPSRMEIEDFIQSLTYHQLVDVAERLLGLIHFQRESE